MKYQAVTETYTPGGIYPIATMPSDLHLPDKQVGTLRTAFRNYGRMLDHYPPHSKRNPTPHRVWKYRRTSSEYIHVTTITEKGM